MNTSLLYHSFLELETLAAPPPPLFREIFPLPAKKMFHVKRLRRRFFGGLRPRGCLFHVKRNGGLHLRRGLLF